MDRFERGAQLYTALAHPDRLRLLAALCEGEQCVCHLTARLGQRQPYVSQHLAQLLDTGLVLKRKAGLRVYYRLADRRARGLLRQVGLGEGALARGTHGRACACPRCASQRDWVEETC